MMQTDVKATYATSSPATITQNRTRLKGYTYVGSGSAGSISYADGAGNVIWQAIVPATDTQTVTVCIPCEGILANNSLIATFSGVSYLTTIYG